MANELERGIKKYIAIKRAERRLQNRLADIDWEYDVLLPEVSQIKLTAAESLELPEFIIEDEN